MSVNSIKCVAGVSSGEDAGRSDGMSSLTPITTDSAILNPTGMSYLAPEGNIAPSSSSATEKNGTSKGTLSSTNNVLPPVGKLTKKQRRWRNQQFKQLNQSASGQVGQNTPKRPHEEGDTPPAFRQAAKKRSYAQVVQESIGELIIYNESSPVGKISMEQQVAIKTELTQLLDSEISSLVPNIPRFASFRLLRGYSTVAYENEAANAWLRSKVPYLKALEGSLFKVIRKEDLPKPVKFNVWVSGSPDEPKKVMDRLVMYNPSLVTTAWTVQFVDKKERPVLGQVIRFCIPQDSMEALRALNFMPYFGLDRLLFQEVKFPATKKANNAESAVGGLAAINTN